MPDVLRGYWIRLETKVMVAVLSVLVTLPVLTLWMVDRHLREQVQREAEMALSVARASVTHALRMRNAEIAGRFRSTLYDQRFFKILFELPERDAPTMQAFLKEYVLNEYPDTEMAIFLDPDRSLFAKARTGGPAAVTFEKLAAAADELVRAALHGDSVSENLVVGGRVYDVVAVPIIPPGRGVAGVLLFGIPINDATLQSVQPPGTHILILAGNEVAAGTFRDAVQGPLVLRQLAEREAAGTDVPITVRGERFRPATGELDPVSARQGVRYVVLSGIEQRLSAFERMRVTLFGLTALGIVLSAGVVWFFVRRITRPLVALRDSAEAVGRGDFSRRIERFSNDECGELANAFNRMTASLQTSRAELERTMQQLRATQGQLIQSEKLSAVGQFVAGVAHELNNPLTAVVGYSEMLHDMTSDEKMRVHLDRVAKSALRCHKIVQSLLSFARQHAPERTVVDLRVVVDDVLDIMSYDLRTSNVKVVREIGPDLPRLMADPHQLQQVFVNLIGNARQAMESFQREGRILIRATAGEGVMTIAIQDNGPGIKPDHLARIFDPFFTTKPVGKGTGLGLSLTYGIIQEHGGKISACSEPGQGATFVIELPLASEEGETVDEAANLPEVPARAAGRQISGRRVLVIDDEEWILDLAAELLRAEGHAVDTAVGGQQAMDLLRRQTYDVIVSDWKMPGLNGVRLFEHLRATDVAAARRMLFMTGDVVSDTFQEFLRVHGLSCLSKPFATGEFRAAVARMISGARA